MIALSKKCSIILSLLVIVAVSINVASAQQSTNNFGAQRLQELKNRNNASWHTSNTLQNRIQAGAVRRDRFAPRLSSSSRSKTKPFTGINRGPTVSPYLALNNPLAQASDYFNIVRPRQQQQRINQQQQRVNQQVRRENLANQHRLNQIAASGPFSMRGSEDRAPTGHVAGRMQFGNYLNTGGYFPPPTSPKRE